jgi:lantibiotic modifying enzyme
MPPLISSDSSDGQLIRRILTELTGCIKTNLRPDAALMNGRAGQLLFCYELAKFDPSLMEESWLNEQLELLIEQIPQVLPETNLCRGLTGIGWLLDYISSEQLPGIDLTEHLDDFLLSQISVEQWHGDFESVNGLTGWVPYLVRRLKRGHCHQHVVQLLRHLPQLADKITTELWAWPTSPQSPFRIDKTDLTMAEYNLGLAHGQPAVLAAMLPLLQFPQFRRQALEILQPGMNWLLSQRFDPPRQYCHFGALSGQDRGSRLGWCYGDLPIALILARSATLLDNVEYRQLAKQISHSAAFRDQVLGKVSDAGLCHGSAGVMLLFMLINSFLNDGLLSDSAHRWLENTLARYRAQGIHGFNRFTGAEPEVNTCLLDGYAGIGLCLLAALGATTNWTDVLLLA